MSLAFSSPNPKTYSKVIDPDLIDIEIIEKILSDQDIEYETDDNEIQITQGLAFDVFITIEEDKKLIKLRTYVKLNPNISVIQIKDIVDKLNNDTAPLKFTDRYYKDKKPPHGFIEGDYYFFYLFDFTPEYFLYLIRFFSMAFADAVKSVNKNKKIADALTQG